MLILSLQAMSSLVNGIKAEAEKEEDSDAQKRLLAAAKNLADATAKMVEAAKVGSLSHSLYVDEIPNTEIIGNLS